MHMTMELLLGSASPRRREILAFFHLPFRQVESHFDEHCISREVGPENYVCEVARGKAHALARRFPDAYILTADTEVSYAGKIYGKPTSHQEAMQMLEELSGHWHSVHTGMTLMRGTEEHVAVEETRVLFHPTTVKQRERYLAAIHTFDKAGGYAVQGTGSILINRIEGCYYNVMGLPIHTLQKLLKKMDIDLWDFLASPS